MNISQYLPEVEGDNLPQGKVSPTSTLMYAFNFMLWWREWEEPGCLKYLKALQEDTGNNSHISSLWTYCQNLPVVRGGGAVYPGVNCPHPPNNPHVLFHLLLWYKGLRIAWLFEVSESHSRGYWKQVLLSRPYEHSPYLPQPPDPRHPHPTFCTLSFLCYDKGNEKSLVIWSFGKPFKKILETILMSHLYKHSHNLPAVEGDSLPWGKVSAPPPHTHTLNLYVLFHFYVMMKGIEKSLLVIWSFWTPFKRILETISHISSLWTQSE